MPMPARTVLPAKLAAAEKHIAGWKVHEILGEAKCFFCLGGWCDVGVGACLGAVL